MKNLARRLARLSRHYGDYHPCRLCGRLTQHALLCWLCGLCGECHGHPFTAPPVPDPEVQKEVPHA